jgi:CBS domain-containing protein
MNVADILRRKGRGIVSVPPDTILAEAVRLMAEQRIGTVLVVDRDGTIGGILSERDLVRIIARYGAEAGNFPIGDLAT